MKPMYKIHMVGETYEITKDQFDWMVKQGASYYENSGTKYINLNVYKGDLS